MSLNATNFVVQGPIKSADLKQFVDLFTGVMSDQPVTFRNATMIGGAQGSSTPPLKLFGVAGQTGNLIELYPTSGSANPTFGFGALGNFAWGPGSPAANDTFLSRIALQNGHVADTAGLLVQPYLEVAGNISALGYTFTNQATLTGPTGTPFLLVINQDLTVNRNLAVNQDLTVTRDLVVNRDEWLTRTLVIGTAAAGSQPLIRNPVNDATKGYLALEAPAQIVTISGKISSYVNGNAYFDGVSWFRYDVAQPATSFQATSSGNFYWYEAAAGANPIGGSWVQQMMLDTTGGLTLPGSLAVGGWVSFVSGLGTTSGGTFRNLLTLGTEELWWDGLGGGFRWVNQANSVQWMSLNAGNLAVAGTVSGTVFTCSGSNQYNWADGSYILQAGGAIYIRPVQPSVYIQTAAGAWADLTTRSLIVNGNLNLSNILILQQNQPIYFGDANTQIVSVSRTTYFDEFSGGWRWRNSAGGLATCMTLQSNGALTIPNLLTATSVTSQGSAFIHGTQFISDLTNSFYRTPGAGSGHYFQNNAAAYVPCLALSFSVMSARRFKTDIRVLDDPLSLVQDDRLHAVRYTEISSDKPNVGFVAEDWLPVLPEVVARDPDGEVAAVDYDRIGAITFEALKQYIAATEARLARADARLAVLERRAA